MSEETWHWSDTAINPQFFDLIDGEVLLPLIFNLLWWSKWTLGFSVISMLLAWQLKRMGYSFGALWRNLRLRLLLVAGPVRSARPRRDLYRMARVGVV